MTVRFFGGSLNHCGTGIIAHKDADIEFHGDFQTNNCGVGMAFYASPEELRILQEKAKEHMQEIKELAEKLAQTKPELRKNVLTASAVFSAMAVGSNAATVTQFLIDHFPFIAELLSNI